MRNSKLLVTEHMADHGDSFSICFVTCGHNLVIHFIQRIHLDRRTLFGGLRVRRSVCRYGHTGRLGASRALATTVPSAWCLNLIDQAHKSLTQSDPIQPPVPD